MKKILIGFAIFIIALSVWHSDLIAYGLMQARGQLKVMINARPIEDYLADVTFPDSLKSKLKLVQEVKEFSVSNLSIEDSNNYTTLFDQQGKVTLWNVTACEPFELTAKNWSFPLIGSFPYKGFFDLQKARRR